MLDPPPGRTRVLEIDGLALHVLDHGAPGDGDAPPVLLLHGGMAHARWWDFVAPALAGAARPYAIDRRGHGDSAWTDVERYGWERDLLDLEEAMRLLSPAPWTLVGHSQGALLAVHLTTRGRVPVARLVLVDVPLDPTSPRLTRAGQAFNRIPQLRWASLEDAMRRFQPFPAPHRIPEPALRHLARHSFKPTEDGGWMSKFHWKMYQRDRARDGNPLADFRERLRRVGVPALSVRGAESTILSAAEQEELVALLPQGRGVEIAGATHSLHAEQPDAVARAIRDFVTP